MQIRELAALSRDELIEIINKQQAEMDAVGAGGVSLMGDAKDGEIARLKKAALKVIEMNRQHAKDQCGDADKAESWACVFTLRAALAPQEES